MKITFALITVALLGVSDDPHPPRADAAAGLADRLRGLEGRVDPAGPGRAAELRRMLARDAQARLRAANVRENAAWRSGADRVDWERYRDERLEALRRSLGSSPPALERLEVRTTG